MSTPSGGRGGNTSPAREGALPRSVTVLVPATSANVGPGFDVMGLALNLEARFTLSRSNTYEVRGCEQRFRGHDNLVWTSYLAACNSFGVKSHVLALDINSPIPLSGGLGSSSACVIAGIMAAQLLSGLPYDALATLDLAGRIEGHPDNVAPAVLGGLVASISDEQGIETMHFPVAENLRFVALSPASEVRTTEARKILPRMVPAETAVWQAGHLLAMVRALETGDARLLARAARDRLHEPYRQTLIEDYPLLRTTSLDAGAAAFTISGSGSTMLAICDGDKTARRVERAARDATGGLKTWILQASPNGARVEDVRYT